MFKNIFLGIFGIVIVIGSILLFNSSKTQNQNRISQEKGFDFSIIKSPICGDNNTDLYCYKDYYSELVVKGGLDEAFKYLKKQYEVNGYVRSQCHSITHFIGHSAIGLYPTVSLAFAKGDPFCWSGYYHGVMEEMVETVGPEKISTELNNICSGIIGRESYSFDYYNCVHGLGHGLMAMTYNNLFKSLNLCDSLSGSWEKTSCYGGVFMENIMADVRGEGTDFLKPSDPLYPCTAVDDRYKSSCYLMQTSYMLRVNNHNFEEVFRQCGKADNGYENICFQSLGRDASGQTISDKDRTRNLCYLGKNFDEKSNCIVGAVKDFISYHHSDVQAKDFCNSLTDDLKNVCLPTVEVYYRSF